MKIIKPLHLTVLHKSFTYLENDIFSVSVLIGFSLKTGEIQLEQKVWQTIGDQLDGAIFDAAMPKEVGEVLVVGSLIAPMAAEIEAGSVKLVIERKNKQGVYQPAVNKELAIFGDRHWYKLLGAGLSPSEPTFFSEMPITYQNAFGGEGFSLNPEGKGKNVVETEFGERQYLPNIEYRNNLITSPSAQPSPASFGRVDIMNSQRLSKAGTYDQKYIETRMPGLPDDINWLYFNDAAEDQWLDGYFAGDETYSITNMNSDHQVLSGTLPQIYGRAFVNQQVPIVDSEGHSTGETEVQFKEVPTQLDTLYLFPNADLGVMIYRGTIEAFSDIGTDIDALLLACEGRQDSPRSKKHYEDQLTKRIDPEHGYKYALFSSPLIADGLQCGFQKVQEDYDFPLEMLGKANLDEFTANKKQEAESELDDAKIKIIEQCKSVGIDPTPYIEKIDNPEKTAEQLKIEEMLERMAPGIVNDPENIDVFNVDFSVMDEITAYQQELAEKSKTDAKDYIAQEIEKLKQEDDTGLFDDAINKLENKIEEIDMPPMWPRVDVSDQLSEIKQQVSEAESQIEQLRQQGVPDADLPTVDIDLPAIEAKFEDAEVKMKDAYLMGAHLMGKMRSPHPEKEQSLAQIFMNKFRKGESLAGGDFACIDVSGEDLAGIDLSGCYLEGVNFSGCNLTNANLSKAILANANLENATLIDAVCEGANIGAANLKYANFTRANLTKSQLGGSDFLSTQLVECPLAESNFIDSRFDKTRFNGANLTKCNFINPVFLTCEFVETDLSQANFVEGQFTDCDFSKSILDGANFVKAKADNNCFVDARMLNVRFVGGCDLNSCDFTGVDAKKSCFRENQLRGADFKYSTLDEADFSGSQLAEANFNGAKAYRTQFMSSLCRSTKFSATNLMEGSLYKAYVVGADFTNANLYCVNFIDSTLGQNKYAGANLDQTILKQWRP